MRVDESYGRAGASSSRIYHSCTSQVLLLKSSIYSRMCKELSIHYSVGWYKYGGRGKGKYTREVKILPPATPFPSPSRPTLSPSRRHQFAGALHTQHQVRITSLESPRRRPPEHPPLSPVIIPSWYTVVESRHLIFPCPYRTPLILYPAFG